MAGPARASSAAALVTLALLGGAQPARAGTKVPSHRELKGGLAIGGVTSIATDSTAGALDLDLMGEMLESAVLDRCPDLPVTGAFKVRSTLGEDDYLRMLDFFQRTGQLESTFRASLASSAGRTYRYLVLARIVEAGVHRHRKKEDADGDPKTDDTEIVKTAEQKVKVDFGIFDFARDGRRVWEKAYDHSESNVVTAPASYNPFGSQTVAAGLFGALHIGDPEDPLAPAVMSVMPAIFEEFAKKLPKK